MEFYFYRMHNVCVILLTLHMYPIFLYPLPIKLKSLDELDFI